ncbi:MAG: HAMP domain-containing histidine kinase, partial [Desulfuromonadales bacterium]|nr:HAMP domain-containing histidine kinase [Desulfuromonadales bacterium]
TALVTAVAHDMRNPLGAMLTTLHVLERNMPGDRATTTSLQRLRRGIDRCERTLGRLTDFLRVEELHPEATRLDSWLAAMINTQSLPDGVSLAFRAGLPDVRITIDRRLLERALRQLIENAVEALRVDEPAGTVAVSTRPLGETVEIKVVDN